MSSFKYARFLGPVGRVIDNLRGSSQWNDRVKESILEDLDDDIHRLIHSRIDILEWRGIFRELIKLETRIGTNELRQRLHDLFKEGVDDAS